MRFVGAAFPRTGTVSIKRAIEVLMPDRRCYHMHEVALNQGHVPVWEAAWMDPPDWKEFLSGYSGTVDGPACLFWKQISDAFPDAFILLTIREPQDWWESIHETIYTINRRPEMREKPLVVMMRRILFDDFFQGKFEDRAFAADVFRQYCDDVRASVPSDRLLEYRITEGWGPLCERLGCAIPDRDFPCANTREEFLVRNKEGKSGRQGGSEAEERN